MDDFNLKRIVPFFYLLIIKEIMLETFFQQLILYILS
jgi:hypothetical protein